jgi:hypothetical protein
MPWTGFPVWGRKEKGPHAKCIIQIYCQLHFCLLYVKMAIIENQASFFRDPAVWSRQHIKNASQADRKNLRARCAAKAKVPRPPSFDSSGHIAVKQTYWL